MSPEDRALAKKLRAMGSKAAADWFLSEKPHSDSESWHAAITLIPRLSWKPSDQIRLANEYLQALPFQNSNRYEMLIKIMPIHRFIEVSQPFLKPGIPGMDLFTYYTVHHLWEKAETDKERKLVSDFKTQLKQLGY